MIVDEYLKEKLGKFKIGHKIYSKLTEKKKVLQKYWGRLSFTVM